MKQLFCRFLKNVEVWRPRYPFKSCCLRPELSNGGNDMVTRRFKHFLLKETHIFSILWKVKGEWSREIYEIRQKSKNADSLNFEAVHRKI